jgi:3-carboxy-cis,cis-muconate cycloisomerase
MDASIRSARVDALFAETATLSRYLQVEVALAQTEALLGIIPERAALAIAASATVENIDRERYRQDFATVGFPIVGLVRQLTKLVPDGMGEFTHWGATTQDIMDTGLVLALKEVVAWTEQALDTIIGDLAHIADEHSQTLMIGRSQMQHAVPITFGYKAAGWLVTLMRHQRRLDELRPRLLQVQFGGAVGTLAALHPEGPAVRHGLAERLDLGEPTISWHTHRDSLCEVVTYFGLLTATLAKIATDIMLMAQTEVAEVHEPTTKDRGVSSAMPHKRNPVLSQQIIVAARLTRAQVASMLEAMVQDHERGSATWQMEWSIIPVTAAYALSALEHILELVAGLEIHQERMRENLGLSHQLVYAEAVMMALAPQLGRQKAHDLVDAAVSDARDGKSFVDALQQSQEIHNILSASELRRIFGGEAHVQAAERMVRDVLAAYIDRQKPQ